jgi:hypothetical protein
LSSVEVNGQPWRQFKSEWVELPGKVGAATAVQACDHIHALPRSGGQGGVFSIGAISQEEVALFELVPECAQQAQVMVMETAQDDVEDGPAGQGEERDKPQDGKAAAGFLR